MATWNLLPASSCPYHRRCAISRAAIWYFTVEHDFKYPGHGFMGAVLDQGRWREANGDGVIPEGNCTKI